jgi:tyrosyl-tRNA synthetase
MEMVTHERLLSRDMFRKRIEEGAGLYMHELTYPIIQGYDSVALDSDLTIVGSDQLFNEMMGRFYQERFGQPPQVIITTKVTPGIDGKQKQSKSLGNYIGLDHDAREKFGRVMSIPDTLIASYLEVYTGLADERVAELAALAETDPMEAKKVLGQGIVERYHGEEAAAAERRWFEEVFSKGREPEGIEERTFGEAPATAFDLARACLDPGGHSNSDIRRLFQQGAVKLDGEKLADFSAPVALSREGSTLRLGKRIWFKVRLADAT